jgi:hypothetical protein
MNVLAVLLGIWFVIMGIFEIIGALIFSPSLEPRCCHSPDRSSATGDVRAHWTLPAS